MYSIKKLSQGIILAQVLPAEDQTSPSGVLLGKALDGCFVAKVLQVGLPNEKSKVTIVEGDIVLLEGEPNSYNKVGNDLLVDSFSVLAVMQEGVAPTPAPVVPDGKVIPSKVTIE